MLTIQNNNKIVNDVNKKNNIPEQLSLFQDNLPPKPYCSNDLDFGLLIRPIDTAVTMRYIQANKPTNVATLVFDCDYPNAIELTEENNLPTPNIAVINKHNGHSHLLYSLKTPVHKTNVARIKPLAYLSRVEYALREALRADVGYSGLIVKNPLNDHWLTYQIAPKSYEIDELVDYLTLPKKMPKKGLKIGLGRNCDLFERLRHFAYREVIAFRLTSTFDAFKDSIYLKAIEYNVFKEPLPFTEIKSISKSIATWTWRHYTAGMPTADWQQYVKDTHTSEKQAYRQKLQVISRNTQTEEKRATARILRAKGHTQQEIANILNVPQQTIARWVSSK